jgi:manganese oxidase
MMTGFGQFGPIEMGGMFTVVKIRQDLAANDFRDPGAYRHPADSVAYEVKDQAAAAPQRNPGRGEPKPAPKIRPSGHH